MAYISGMGPAIRARRERLHPRLSQRALGEAAGYSAGAGAGVAISRVEGGQMRPGAARLEAIAVALGTSVADLERDAEALGRAGGTTDDARTPKPLRVRLLNAHATVRSRTAAVRDLGDAFNQAHERARRDFFLGFLDDAVRIAGAALPPEPRPLAGRDRGNHRALAHHRVDFTANVVAHALAVLGGTGSPTPPDGAATYAALTAASMFGTASSGAVIPGLSGVAATDIALALLDGGTLAGGTADPGDRTMLLAGVVAAPTAALTADGVAWSARPSRERERDLTEQLAAAEAELAATRAGFEALTRVLPRATEVLDYVALRAGHAHRRWSRQLDAGPVLWSRLSSPQRGRYEEFVIIAACQLTVASLNVAAFLTARGQALTDLVEETEAVLDFVDGLLEEFV